MNILESHIRAAITGMGFLWGNSQELYIGEPEYLGDQSLLFVALEYRKIRIPCLVVNHSEYADVFLSPDIFMSPQNVKFLFVEPALKLSILEHMN